MRFLTLVAVASLALATPGCTLIGAGIGASIPVSKDGNGDSVMSTHTSRGTHALLGAMMGLVADMVVVSLVASALAPWDEMLHYHNSCPSCD